MDYRTFYSRTINEPVPEHWDIHHIDRDRQNNNFTNLVAVPKDIHSNYHYLLTQCQLNLRHLNEFTNIVSKISSFGISGEVCFQRFLISELNNNITKLEQVEKQIVYYITVRNQKAGIGLKEILNAERF